MAVEIAEERPGLPKGFPGCEIKVCPDQMTAELLEAVRLGRAPWTVGSFASAGAQKERVPSCNPLR